MVGGGGEFVATGLSFSSTVSSVLRFLGSAVKGKEAASTTDSPISIFIIASTSVNNRNENSSDSHSAIPSSVHFDIVHNTDDLNHKDKYKGKDEMIHHPPLRSYTQTP